MERVCYDVAQLKTAIEVHDDRDEIVLKGRKGDLGFRIVGGAFCGFLFRDRTPVPPPVKVPSADLSPMMTGRV